MRERLQSEDEQQRDSAAFELSLHELLLRLGCQIEVEPQVPRIQGRPDFHVWDPKGPECYLEAVTVSAEPKPRRASERAMRSLCDWLNRKLPRQDFLALVWYSGRAPVSFSRKKVFNFLMEKLGSVSYQEVLELTRSRGLLAAPYWTYRLPGCAISFQLVPRAEHARGNQRVPVLQFPNCGDEINLDQMVERMRDGVLEKAKKYRGLDKPLVVALSVPKWPITHVDVMLALFGWDDVAHGLTEGPELVKLGMPRKHGVWLEGPSIDGIHYRGLSAVLSWMDLNPGPAGKMDFCVYNNPWAAFPYEGALNLLHRCMIGTEGRSDHVLGLSASDTLSC